MAEGDQKVVVNISLLDRTATLNDVLLELSGEVAKLIIIGAQETFRQTGDIKEVFRFIVRTAVTHGAASAEVAVRTLEEMGCPIKVEEIVDMIEKAYDVLDEEDHKEEKSDKKQKKTSNPPPSKWTK